MRTPECFGASCIGSRDLNDCPSCMYSVTCYEEMRSFLDFEFSSFEGTYEEYLKDLHVGDTDER